jgi:DNA-directed RNA polymerase specialized sigma24 family protein
MPLSEKEILRFLMQSRERISAAAWLVVKDAHVAEDIFQNTVLKAVTFRTKREQDQGLHLQPRPQEISEPSLQSF